MVNSYKILEIHLEFWLVPVLQWSVDRWFVCRLPQQGSGTSQDSLGNYSDQFLPFDQLQASMQLLDFPCPLSVKARTFAQNLDTFSGRFKITSVWFAFTVSINNCDRSSLFSKATP